jgi:phytoene/squalene synthetase
MKPVAPVTKYCMGTSGIVALGCARFLRKAKTSSFRTNPREARGGQPSGLGVAI